MPNWVNNIITFEGNEEDINNVLEFVKGVNCFDFNKIVPMPKSLHITEGSDKDESILYYLARINRKEAAAIIESFKEKTRFLYNDICNEFYKSTPEELLKKTSSFNIRISDDEKKLGIDDAFKLGATYVDNFKKYGSTTWYDWCCRNWGTKWNACDPYVEHKEKGKAIAEFDTAWSAPVPIMCIIAKKYPDVKITLNYADEDIGYNCGNMEFYQNEVITREFQSFDEAYKFACDIWGYEDEEEEEEKDVN